MTKTITIYTDYDIATKLEEPEIFKTIDISPGKLYATLFHKTANCFRNFGERIEYTPKKVNVISIKAVRLSKHQKVTIELEKKN